MAHDLTAKQKGSAPALPPSETREEEPDQPAIKNKLAPLLSEKLKENPFFHFSEETHYIPAWDKIRPEHVLPAIEFAAHKMAQDIRAVIDNKEIPDFQNTIEEIEDSFSLPVYFFLTLYNLVPNNKEEEKIYDDLKEQAYLKFVDIFYDIFFDKDLTEKVIKATTNKTDLELLVKNSLKNNLITEELILSKAYYTTFSRFQRLTDLEKEKLKELEKSLVVVGARSQKNMKYAEQEAGIFVDDPDRLTGLPEYMITAAQEKAAEKGRPGAWFFSAHKDNFYTFRGTVEDRELRTKMWISYHKQASSGPYDNRQTILEFTRLQYKSARLQKYKNPADMTLRYQLAGNMKNAAGFLYGLKNDIRPTALAEVRELKKFALKTDGITDFKPWDFYFYRNKLQKEELGYTSKDFRPYFALENVLAGVFRHYQKLYDLNFEETSHYPLPHPDVRAFNVTDRKSGEHKGIVFLDLYDRKGKPAGRAWNISILPQGQFEGKIRRPVDMINAKIAKAPDGETTLLDHEEILIIAHEFGHALHNILSQCRHQSLSGTAVRRDFVEFPSQLNENWFFEPEVLADFAFHYKTGAPMPEDMKNSIRASREFMQAFLMLDYARKGWLDLAWNIANPKNIKNISSFERKATREFNVFSSGNYNISPHFNHIFGGGYEAGFYGYQFAQAMEARVFDLFVKKGLYHSETAKKLRGILEKGGSSYEHVLYNTLVKGKIGIGEMLKRSGISADIVDCNRKEIGSDKNTFKVTSPDGIKYKITRIGEEFYTKSGKEVYRLNLSEGKINFERVEKLPEVTMN